jgi:chromate transporter
LQKEGGSMQKLKNLISLFLSMFKIGLFTFGGGYAMIHVLEHEFVERKKWLEHDEFMDLVVIAESTPGPIAINCSTYIGYRKEKIWGSIFATLGMVLPSLCIIYCISLFFNQFLEIGWVASAFKGIQVCVIFLILSAGLKMLKKLKKTAFTLTIMSITFACMLAFSLCGLTFSSIFYILISGGLGLLIYAIGYIKSGKNAQKSDNEVQK